MSSTITLNQSKISLSWSYVQTQAYANNVNSGQQNYDGSLGSGSGTGLANKFYVAEDNTGIAGSGTLSLVLDTLTDPFGTAVAFTKVKEIYFQNLATNVATIAKIAPNAVNPFAGAAQPFAGTTPYMSIRAGGALYIASPDSNGYTVDGTHKALDIINLDSGHTLPYFLLIIGE